MSLHPETQCYEFPVVYKENRMWKIIIRLIKQSSRKEFTKIDWDLMSEIQVPILEEYISGTTHIPDDLVAEMWTETGVVQGKITRSIPTYPVEKNKNKKNYRDSFQQAISMAESKYKKKIEEGFVTSLENVSVETDSKVFPMLAKMYTPKAVEYPVLVQPKLDGLRCVAFLDPNQPGVVILQSRTKKLFPSNTLNDRIRNELVKILGHFPPLTYFDGELYNHQTKLQKLNHYARNSDLEQSSNVLEYVLEYHIYDIIRGGEKLPFQERFNDLERVSKYMIQSSVLKSVMTTWANDSDQLDTLYDDFIQKGYEGMMIRNPKGVYQFGTRSGYLLKRKEVFTDEFPIVNWTSGVQGKDLNALIWVCQTQNKHEFKVTPNLTYEERYRLFHTFSEQSERFTQEYQNRLLTVEYRGLSVDRVPQHAKGICIRDIE